MVLTQIIEQEKLVESMIDEICKNIVNEISNASLGGVTGLSANSIPVFGI